MIQFALYTAPLSAGGQIIADYSYKIQGLTIGAGPRGFAEAHGFIPMPLIDAFRLYDRAGLPHCVFSDNAASVLYEGRLEDVNIVANGARVRAFGYARALSDIPYSAMWSVTNLDTFTQAWLASTAAGPTTNRKWDIRTDPGRIGVGLIKNSLYAAGERGEWRYQIPNGSSRNIAGMTCTCTFLASANVTLRVSLYNVSAAFPYSTFSANIYSLVGNGAAQTFVLSLTAANPIIAFGLEATTAHNYAGETGAEYVTFADVHLVSSTANSVNTTLTAGRTNGAGVTCTVGSTVGMYAGQTLYLFNAINQAESVSVTSVTDATHFVATIVNAGAGYPVGTLVFAYMIYADQIAGDLLAVTRAVNASQLASTTGLIQSPGIDLLDETYEDRSMADILDYLIGLGDTQSPPRQWEWGVYDQQQLFFRPQSTTNRAWVIDLADIDIDHTLDQLYNSVYATYQDANNATLRTAIAADGSSVTRYGLTRRKALGVQTTNASVAAVHRDAALADGKDPPPRSRISLARVYDGAGARWPLAYIRAGDMITIRNLPPSLSTTIDRVRSFRLTRTEYHADDDSLTIEPDVPRPTLDALLARLAIGLKEYA